MFNQPTVEQCQEIGAVLVDEAYTLFCDLKIERDFCVQAIGCNCVVFGGSNRIIWSLQHGFQLDVSYCSPDTISKWGAMNGKPKYYRG